MLVEGLKASVRALLHLVYGSFGLKRFRNGSSVIDNFTQRASECGFSKSAPLQISCMIVRTWYRLQSPFAVLIQQVLDHCAGLKYREITIFHRGYLADRVLAPPLRGFSVFGAKIYQLYLIRYA
jgi:hypothetical protein